jgi:hypothetical protein
MNWIKSNPFVSGLAGITLLICGILFFLASQSRTRYETAKADFESAFQAVSSSESLPLYPTSENRDGKRKALDEHRAAIADLSKLFDKYRPEKLENISPQAFTDRLKAANQEVTEAFANSKTVLPEDFFLGFDIYRNQLAKSEATGVLLQQLEGIKTAFLGLAEARPGTLLKVYRQALAEEEGGTYQPAPNDIARYFSVELAFESSESAARDFLSSLGATESHYFIIRTLKIKNNRDSPPKVADATFEPSEDEEAELAPGNPFDNVFTEEEEITEESDTPDTAVDADAEATEEPSEEETSSPEVDTSRILAQVLGSEEIIVFVRFDIAIFLPTKELPKP